jgi:D-tyrosyl-tRNA(Tyr) deacylase
VRIVVQRVDGAAVSVPGGDGAREARIGAGLLALVGFASHDGDEALAWGAKKLADLRLFASPEQDSGFDRSLRETGGQLLVVSQFTLYGDARKGRRPDFTAAAPAERAAGLYDRFCALCEAELPGRVARGVFGAHMKVSLVNDGPVTILLER